MKEWNIFLLLLQFPLRCPDIMAFTQVRNLSIPKRKQSLLTEDPIENKYNKQGETDAGIKGFYAY